jgi:hypothetical protein
MPNMNAAGMAWNDQLYGEVDGEAIIVAVGKLLRYEFDESMGIVDVMEDKTRCDT